MNIELKNIKDNNLNDLIKISKNMKSSTNNIRNNLKDQINTFKDQNNKLEKSKNTLDLNTFRFKDLQTAIGNQYGRLFRMSIILIVLIFVLIYI